MINSFAYIVALLLSANSISESQLESNLHSHKEVLLLMGSRFEITAVAVQIEQAEKAVDQSIAEIKRIERLISSWDPNSQTSAINDAAGITSVKVAPELFNLIERSLKISKLTDGAFDISFASIEKLYNFDGEEHPLPSEVERSSSIQKINWQDILINRENHTVFLRKKGMKIGFGGIGKGYAANQAVKLMKQDPSLRGGIVNASGDLYAWGDNGRPDVWSIQIADPENIRKSIGQLDINNAAVVTSGDYEKFFTNNGKRYAHIIDPKTGIPTSGIKSATIICPDAELGDALATAIFVLGINDGLTLINKLKNVEALIISDTNDIYKSKRLEFNKVKL